MVTITIVRHPVRHFQATIVEYARVIHTLYAEDATTINRQAIAWCTDHQKPITRIVLR